MREEIAIPGATKPLTQTRHETVRVVVVSRRERTTYYLPPANDDSRIMTGDDHPSEPAREDSTRQLYVEFEVEPAPDSSCPLREFDREVTAVRQQQTGDNCHTDLTLAADDCGCDDDGCTEVVHTSSSVDPTCPCTAFGEYGCVSRITGIIDDGMMIETFLPDRDVLTDLVSDLKPVVDGISLRRLKRVGAIDADGRQATVTLDLFELTETQRETAAGGRRRRILRPTPGGLARGARRRARYFGFGALPAAQSRRVEADDHRFRGVARLILPATVARRGSIPDVERLQGYLTVRRPQHSPPVPPEAAYGTTRGTRRDRPAKARRIGS